MNVDVSFMDKIRILRQTTDRIPVPIEAEMFTSDPEKLSFIKSDTLMLRDVSARLQMQGAILNDVIKDSTLLFRTPMLVMMSADDEIINTEKTKKNFFDSLSCRKKLVEYRGVKHFLIFEKSKDAAIDEIISWTDNF